MIFGKKKYFILAKMPVGQGGSNFSFKGLADITTKELVMYSWFQIPKMRRVGKALITNRHAVDFYICKKVE